MTLEQIATRFPKLAGQNYADKIRFFFWALQCEMGKSRIMPVNISECFATLNIAPPSSINPFLKQMCDRKEILKDRNGYWLEHSTRLRLEKRYKARPSEAAIDALLAGLPDQIPDLNERAFLSEAIICYRVRALRAAIVMTWNMAYDHLMRFVLAKHLAAFNAQWPVSYPREHSKARISKISCFDDFAELKESQVIQICRSAAIISGDAYKILEEKLGRRNTAAHPSSVEITQIQAEALIDDLVRNVVLKYQ